MPPAHPLSAFRATLPVMFGYIPLGIAFGVLFAQLGHPWYMATAMGLAVYAGAAQFMAVGLLAAGAGIWEIGLATLLLNARHMFYGLSMAARFPRGPSRAYLIFGLTDETYSLLAAAGPASPGFYLTVTALNQVYWVLGCTVGAWLGVDTALDLRGLDFVLTALFVVLAIEQALTVRDARPFLLAAVCTLLAWALAGAQHMLLVGLALTTISLLVVYRRQWPTNAI